MTEQEQEIVELIADELGCADSSHVQPSSHLQNDLEADSLDRLTLTMRLEDEYGFEIPDEDAEKIQTVQDVFDYVASHAK